MTKRRKGSGTSRHPIKKKIKDYHFDWIDISRLCRFTKTQLGYSL